MAWGEIKVEDQRKLFCEAILVEGLTHSEACRQFDITRATGYKWVERYKEKSENGLKNESSARKTQAHATPPEIVEKILNFKHEKLTWGPKKIHAKLKEIYPTINWPSRKTIEKIFTNNGLVKSRKLRRRLPANSNPLTQSERANDVWCMDFKGWCLTSDRYKFDPFTLSDHHTRYLIRCLKLDLNDTEHVWAILDTVFREYGLPKIIRSDNGPPFATCSPGRLSKLSVRLIKAGVLPEWIEPGKPQQNGRHERMHLTMEQECFYPDELNLKDQTTKLDEFQLYYNFERPHEAIGQKTPGSIYKPSERIWTGKLKPIEYSDEYKIGRVRSCGTMWWKGKVMYIGRVFAGEQLGIKEEEGLSVYFGPIFLGQLKNDQLEVIRRETRKRYKEKVE